MRHKKSEAPRSNRGNSQHKYSKDFPQYTTHRKRSQSPKIKVTFCCAICATSAHVRVERSLRIKRRGRILIVSGSNYNAVQDTLIDEGFTRRSCDTDCRVCFEIRVLFVRGRK